MLPTCTDTERKKPEIHSEVDLPFADSSHPSGDFYNEIELQRLKHNQNTENLKNNVGKHLLYGCLIAIAVFAAADAYWDIDSPIFTSAFEIAKVVATTVLGYLFGTREKS